MQNKYSGWSPAEYSVRFADDSGRMNLPLGQRIAAIEWKFELDNLTITFAQLSLILHIILNQFGERSKLFPSIQVVKITRILYFDVSDSDISSAEPNKIIKVNSSSENSDSERYFFRLWRGSHGKSIDIFVWPKK